MTLTSDLNRCREHLATQSLEQLKDVAIAAVHRFDPRVATGPEMEGLQELGHLINHAVVNTGGCKVEALLWAERTTAIGLSHLWPLEDTP